MVIQVTCALIFSEGKLLITQRSEKMSHPLQWEFPGGKMRSGETPENCLKREIGEELQIEIFIKRRLPEVRHSYKEKKVNLIPFICEIKSGRIALVEHKEYAWVKSADIGNYPLLDADIQIVKDVLDDRERLLF